jgi:hypothetical protein
MARVFQKKLTKSDKKWAMASPSTLHSRGIETERDEAKAGAGEASRSIRREERERRE